MREMRKMQPRVRDGSGSCQDTGQRGMYPLRRLCGRLPCGGNPPWLQDRSGVRRRGGRECGRGLTLTGLRQRVPGQIRVPEGGMQAVQELFLHINPAQKKKP